MTRDVTRSGRWVFSGNGDITGDVGISGNTEIGGTLKITGVTTLENDLNVKTGHKITIEGSSPLRLGVGPNGLPAMYFGSGASVEGTSTGARMVSAGSPYVEASTNSAQMVSGTRAVRVTDGATFVIGLAESANPPNAYIDSAGRLFKATG